jgi:hypothetical protein
MNRDGGKCIAKINGTYICIFLYILFYSLGTTIALYEKNNIFINMLYNINSINALITICCISLHTCTAYDNNILLCILCRLIVFEQLTFTPHIKICTFRLYNIHKSTWLYQLRAEYVCTYS